MPDKTYTTAFGKVLTVTAGLGGDTFGTFERKSNGNLRRIRSAELPMRPTLDLAQHDFEQWVIHKWTFGTKAEKIGIQPIFVELFAGKVEKEQHAD